MTTSTPQPSGPGPDTNEVFAALSNPRRRTVLQVLERQSTIGLSELATRVVRQEGEESEVADTDVERVCLDLYHRHLPQLADAGFVEFAEESNTVSLFVDRSDDVPPRLIALD